MKLFFDLTGNVAVVMILSSLCMYFVLSSKAKYSGVVNGLLFGICTLTVMHNKVYFDAGHFVDFSNVVMVLAGYLGGLSTALIAGSVSGLFRWYQGGAGAVETFVIVYTLGLLGAWLHKKSALKFDTFRDALNLFGHGVLTAVITLLITSPASLKNISNLYKLIKTALPSFFLTPVVILIVFFLLSLIQKTLCKSMFLNFLLNESPLMLVCFDSEGPIWVSSSLSRNPTLNKYVANTLELNPDREKTILEHKKICFSELETEDKRIVQVKIFPAELPQGKQAMVGVFSDITNLRETEKEMARLDRLNLLGEMAASIGHEIRNPMTSVRGFLQLMGQKDQFKDDQKFFNLMIDELDRANCIIGEFLSIAKGQRTELKLDNLNLIIELLMPLIQADALKQDKMVQVELNEIPDLMLNEKEIRQIILNLTRNGFEAMPPGKTLTIRTYTEEEDVIISVRDEGAGIPCDILQKIGTPFFTTKENGTGLGLAVCYSIADRHGAKISFDTSPSGTTFFIKFIMPDSASKSEDFKQKSLAEAS